METKGEYLQPKIRAVEVEGEIRQLKTMVDGSVNVVINLPEHCLPQVSQLLQWHREYVRVLIELVSNE